MSDVRHRQAERAVLAALGCGEDVEARVRLLALRLRRGELTRERVELAAYMGDRASRELLAEGPPNWGHARGLGDGACLPAGVCWRCGWVNGSYGSRGLARWGSHTMVRAAIAAARVAYAAWVAYQGTCTMGIFPRAGETLEAAAERAWVDRITPPLRVIEAAEAWLDSALYDGPALGAWRAAIAELMAAGCGDLGWIPNSPNPFDGGAALALSIDRAAARTSWDDVRKAIAGALIPRALGEDNA